MACLEEADPGREENNRDACGLGKGKLIRERKSLVGRQYHVPGVAPEPEKGHGPVPLGPAVHALAHSGDFSCHLETRGIGHVRNLTIEAGPLEQVGEVHAGPTDLQLDFPGARWQEGNVPLHHDLWGAELRDQDSLGGVRHSASPEKHDQSHRGHHGPDGKDIKEQVPLGEPGLGLRSFVLPALHLGPCFGPDEGDGGLEEE